MNYAASKNRYYRPFGPRKPSRRGPARDGWTGEGAGGAGGAGGGMDGDRFRGEEKSFLLPIVKALQFDESIESTLALPGFP